MAIDLAKIERWFSYHPPRTDQVERYEAIRAAGKQFALVILDQTPSCADQSAAIRHIRNAVSTANAAIACGGI